MFIIRRIAVFVVLLLAIFIGASAVLENFAESQLSIGLARTLGLKARPTVEIDSFPIMWRVIQGKIPKVTVSARDFELQNLEIAELLIDMRGVGANIDVLIRSDRFDLSVEQGVASARITEDSINAFLKKEGENVHVTFKPDGTVFVRADRVVARRKRRFEATGRLSLGGRTLTFKPSRVTVDGAPPSAGLAPTARRETAFSVEVPKFPGGILPSKVVVTKEELTLVANLDGYVLKLAK
jgi:DUF2993 family protein